MRVCDSQRLLRDTSGQAENLSIFFPFFVNRVPTFFSGQRLLRDTSGEAAGGGEEEAGGGERRVLHRIPPVSPPNSQPRILQNCVIEHDARIAVEYCSLAFRITPPDFRVVASPEAGPTARGWRRRLRASRRASGSR